MAEPEAENVFEERLKELEVRVDVLEKKQSALEEAAALARKVAKMWGVKL